MEIKVGKLIDLLSNSKWVSLVDFRKRGSGVSLDSERGTTQTAVKVPKCWLSVNLKGCPRPETARRLA